MQTSPVVSLKTTIKWLFGMLHFFSSTQNLSFSYIFLFSLAFSLIYVSSAGTNLTSGFSRTVCASVSQLVIRNLTLTIYWHYQLLPFLFQTHRLSLMWVFTYWHTFFFFFWKAFYSNKWKRKSTQWSPSVMIQNFKLYSGCWKKKALNEELWGKWNKINDVSLPFKLYVHPPMPPWLLSERNKSHPFKGFSNSNTSIRCTLLPYISLSVITSLVMLASRYS